MRAWGLALSVVVCGACGGSSKPKPAPLANHASPPVAKPAPAEDGGDGYGGLAYGGDTYGGDNDDGQPADLTGDPSAAELPSCDAITASPSLLAPVTTLDGDDGAWSEALRRNVLRATCTADTWTPETIDCFSKVDSPEGMESCVGALAEPEREAIMKKVASLEELAKQTAKLRKTSSKITCKAVAAAYYADAKWKDQPAGAKPAERKQALATSRTAMAKVCTDAAWSPSMRACLVVGSDECFPAAGLAQTRWTLPPMEIPSVGIAECDDYAAETLKIVGCEKLPPDARQAIKQSFDESFKQFANVPADRKQDVATACRTAADAMRQAGHSIGC